VHLSVLVSPASVGAHSSPTRNSLRSVRSVRSRAVPVPHVRPVPFASLAFTPPPLLRPCNGGGGGGAGGGVAREGARSPVQMSGFAVLAPPPVRPALNLTVPQPVGGSAGRPAQASKGSCVTPGGVRDPDARAPARERQGRDRGERDVSVAERNVQWQKGGQRP
jgi:hypothetical protein